MDGAQVNIRRLSILLTLSPLALACGASTVDLDATVMQSSNEPGVLGIVHERVEQIAVDDERLYWSGSHLLRTDGANTWFLHSCQKSNCASTLVTYDAQGSGADNFFSVSGGEIYWYRSYSRALLSCPIAGCNGTPNTLATDFGFSAGAFDGDSFYFSDAQSIPQVIDSLPLLEPGPRQPVAAAPGSVHKVVIRDAYAYWQSELNTGSESLLMRTRKDGSSSALEIIANDVKHSNDHGFDLTTDANSIYWTNNQLAGAIHRCPLTGCSGASEQVLAPLRAPQGLLVDGSELYYTHETKPYEYALSSCSLSACAQSLPLIEHLDAPDVVALDDQYVYAATTEQDVSPNNFETDTIAKIHRLPKPDRGAP